MDKIENKNFFKISLYKYLEEDDGESKLKKED